MRNFVVDAFQALTWIALIGFIAYCTWVGYHWNQFGIALPGLSSIAPWQGAVAGLVAGVLGGIFVSGLIFTLLDIRAGTDRIQAMLEHEIRRRHVGADEG